MASAASAAVPGSRSWPEESGPMLHRERVGDPRERVTDRAAQFPVDGGQFGPDAEERRVPYPEVGVGLHPAAHVLPSRHAARTGQRAERVVDLLRIGGRLDHQGPQQVLFVGEVEVEGAVRRLGDLDDVVDPGGVVAAPVEGDHCGVEQLAHRAPALAAQDPLAGRCADGVRIVAGERPGGRPFFAAGLDPLEPLGGPDRGAERDGFPGLGVTSVSGFSGAAPGHDGRSAVPCQVNGSAGPRSKWLT